VKKDLRMETANFGTLLKEAREKRKISLSEISNATKLSVSALKLMEQGNLDDLPPDVFVRGFIRSYARTLRISSNEPLELLDQVLLERRRASEPMVVSDLRPSRKPMADRSMVERSMGERSTGERSMKTGRSQPAPMLEPPVEDDAQAPRRGIGLAVFVIIVLLIATITLSLFLRQQPQSGEGLSLQEAVPQVLSQPRDV
jgi:transcriptional regulator with XRE-family HTH domain